MDESLKQEARRYADQIIDQRLGSMESELGRHRGILENVYEVIERLVRVEERIILLYEQEKNKGMAIAKLEERVGVLEKEGATASNEVKGIANIRTAFYTAIATGLAMFLVNKFTG